jgi:hypothetical protein
MLRQFAHILFIVPALLGIVGCSPKITIIHQDPTNQRVLIRIDHGEVDTLEFGGKTSEKVSRGMHYVEAIPDGEKNCPWTENGKGWSIWVDKGTVLTLLEPTAPHVDNTSNEMTQSLDLTSPYQGNDEASEKQIRVPDKEDQ